METLHPRAQTGIGVVVPHDMALDRELWRWTPDDVSLRLTRTPRSQLDVNAEMIARISESDLVAAAAGDLVSTEPSVFAYACTSGSFIRGVSGERALTQAMQHAGAPAAVTTSGAVREGLTRLGVSRVAIATPYDEQLTALLGDFLVEGGIRLVGSAQLGLSNDIWKVPYETTAALIREADVPEAQAVVVSCTNLPTYDLIAPLESELGKPVVTANQATMWASLRILRRFAVGPGQRLLEVA